MNNQKTEAQNYLFQQQQNLSSKIEDQTKSKSNINNNSYFPKHDLTQGGYEETLQVIEPKKLERAESQQKLEETEPLIDNYNNNNSPKKSNPERDSQISSQNNKNNSNKMNDPNFLYEDEKQLLEIKDINPLNNMNTDNNDNNRALSDFPGTSSDKNEEQKVNQNYSSSEEKHNEEYKELNMQDLALTNKYDPTGPQHDLCSCAVCENIYLDSLSNHTPLKVGSCFVCQNQYNDESLKFYAEKLEYIKNH